MTTPPPSRTPLLLLVPLVLAVGIGVEVLATFAARLSYPYDLEWMEGGVLAHAWRWKHGLPIYEEPTDWIPMVYPPGYYAVVGSLGSVFGLSPALGRAVSGLATLASCAALVWGARRHLDHPIAGWIGAGVFLACYESSGGFYDLVRPDALAVALLAWSFVLAVEASAARQLAAGVLLFLAFTVKHNVAAFGPALALGLAALHGTPAAWRFGLAAAVPGAAWTLAMQLGTDGHFLGFLWEVPRSHPTVGTRLVPGSVREVGSALVVACFTLAALLPVWTRRAAPQLPWALHVGAPAAGAALAVQAIGAMPEVNGLPPSTDVERLGGMVLVGAAVGAAVVGLAGQAARRRADGAWVLGALVLATAFVTAGLMRAHHGGFLNVFIPLHWTLAAAFAVAIAALARPSDSLPRPVRALGPVLAAGLATAQLVEQRAGLDLERLVPTDEDRAAGDLVVDALRRYPGPVLSPFASWLPAYAGHAPSFHLIALWDIKHPTGPYRDAAARLEASIAAGRWPTALDAAESFGFGVARGYDKTEVVPLTGRALMPRTGWRRRPSVVWTARTPGDAP